MQAKATRTHLDPNGVHGTVVHDPLQPLGAVFRAVPHRQRQHTVLPLVRVQVERAVQVRLTDRLGVQHVHAHRVDVIGLLLTTTVLLPVRVATITTTTVTCGSTTGGANIPRGLALHQATPC